MASEIERWMGHVATERYFLGIDGGGSKCAARLTDAQGKILGEGVSGPASTVLGFEQVFAAMEQAARQALSNAGIDIPLSDLAVGVGLAGLVGERDLIAIRAHPHPYGSLIIRDDAAIACLGAHGGGDGGIVICGTGSNALAHIGGETITVGGWGFRLGDQGSGAQLGYAAVRRAVLEYDGLQPASSIGRDVLARFDGTPETMVDWAADAIPKDFADLAPLVFAYAEDGDAAAIDLVRDCAEAVTHLVKALTQRGVMRIALIGGLSTPVKPWIDPSIKQYLTDPVGDPLDGALRLAGLIGPGPST